MFRAAADGFQPTAYDHRHRSNTTFEHYLVLKSVGQINYRGIRQGRLPLYQVKLMARPGGEQARCTDGYE